jgi:hypothetical protein
VVRLSARTASDLENLIDALVAKKSALVRIVKLIGGDE